MAASMLEYENGMTFRRAPRRVVPGEWTNDDVAVELSGSWHKSAECSGKSLDINSRDMYALCARCPVADECLAEALEAEDGHPAAGRDGVRGGLSPTARQQYELARRGVTRPLSGIRYGRAPSVASQLRGLAARQATREGY